MKRSYKIACLRHFFIIPLALWATVLGAQPTASPPSDPLGRTTPRGTVLGFLTAAHNNNENAVQYLNVPSNQAAVTLAHQLYVVLNRRLPERLDRISDSPEGAASPLNKVDRNIIGAISSAAGEVDIVVERVRRDNNPPIWLFSEETLEAIPDLYDEVTKVATETAFPAFLLRRYLEIPLYHWLAIFVGIPGAYWLTHLLNQLISALVLTLRRRILKRPDLQKIDILPAPIRLFCVALIIRWGLSLVSLPLLGRQFWSSTANVITISASAWILIMLIGMGETAISKRLDPTNPAILFLRFARRTVDLLVVLSAILVCLRLFGLNITAALAGLGVGGIAVALAAQKTLENVIGGMSIVFDRALSVGDVLKWGDTLGTVESIGLRSTRIRTFDQTVMSVPNGQVATATFEILSGRTMFWFHPTLRMRYDTSASQMRSVLEGVRRLLADNACVKQDSTRVRFSGIGASSLDIDIFSHVFASDTPDFLRIQEELLFQIMEIIQAAGAALALPLQAVYLTGPSLSDRSVPADVATDRKRPGVARG